MSTGLISDLLSIQPQASTPAGPMQVKMLPIEYIMRNPDNKIYIVGDLDRLKEDIRENGVRQPLEVIRWANGYKLIGGERRLTACKELLKEGDTRFSSLPCIIVESKGEVDDKIALITANATARDLTDGERLAQYEALKDALTRKKKEGRLEGKVRDEICRILGISGGAAGRLNAISENCDDETKQFLHDGEISLMDAYRNAQNNIEKNRQAEEKAKSPVTVSEKAPDGMETAAEVIQEFAQAPEWIVEEPTWTGGIVKKTIPNPAHAKATEPNPTANKPSGVVCAGESAPAQKEKPSAPPKSARGRNTLIQLAQKALQENAPWVLYKTEPVLGEEFYTQALPGGAALFKRIDKTRAAAKKIFSDDYAIILQDYSFFTCGWLKNYSIESELVRYFELK